ncbi:MAG: hypothetical protein IPL25_19200 [Saprospiraceae bacterium]|nr:hypothetical protein [Candidatus Vicinibacter affinis]
MDAHLISETNNSAFNFDAKVIRGSFTDPCLANICFPFVYDYNLSLKNNCGLEQFSYLAANTALSETIGTFNTTSTSCPSQTASWNGSDGLTAILPTGEYTLSKKLTVNEDATNTYADAYISIGQANGCIKTLADFVAIEQGLSILDGCDISCQECVNELGPDDGSPEWQDLYDLCMEPCTPITPCQISYEMRLEDVSPNGQYGYIGTDATELGFSV